MNKGRLLGVPVLAGVLAISLAGCWPDSSPGVGHACSEQACPAPTGLKDGPVQRHQEHHHPVFGGPSSGPPSISVGTSATIQYDTPSPTVENATVTNTLTYKLDQWTLTQANAGPQPCDSVTVNCIPTTANQENGTSGPAMQFLQLKLTITNNTDQSEGMIPPENPNWDTGSALVPDVMTNIPLQSGMGPAEGSDTPGNPGNTQAGNLDLTLMGQVNPHSTVTGYVTYIVPVIPGGGGSLVYTLNDVKEGPATDGIGGGTSRLVTLYGNQQDVSLTVLGPNS